MVDFEKLLIDLDSEVLFPIRVWIERYKTPIKATGIVLTITSCCYLCHVLTSILTCQ